MPERTTQNAQTLLSPRVPRDTEHERYHPELEEELKECLFCLKRNEMMFDMEVDTDLIEHITPRRACASPKRPSSSSSITSSWRISTARISRCART